MMKLRKLFTALLLVLLVAALIPTTAQASESTSGSCGYNVRYSYSESSKTLTISGSGDMTDYFNAIGATPWETFDIEKIVVKSGVTSIGNNAFRYQVNLTSVTLPSTVTSIGSGAFARCIELASITLPSKLTELGANAFYKTAITSITIPSGVTEIGAGLFSECTSLKSVTVKGKITGIGESAFYLCSALEEITFAGAKADSEIGDHAFYKCTSLKGIDIPEGFWYIDEYAFSNCTSLAYVTFPDTVTSIMGNAFEYCEKLSSVTLPAKLDYLPDFGYTFYGCTNLRNVTMPASAMACIHWSIFRDCESLKYIHVIGDEPSLDAEAKKDAFKNYSTKFTIYYDEGTSGWGSTFCGMPTAVWDGTAKPVVTTGNNATSGAPTLKWKIVENAVTYQVYRSTSKDSGYTRVYTTSGTSFKNSTAEAGVKYYYKVKAIYSDKSYVFGSVVARTCDLPRPTVTLSNVASTGKVKLSWNAVEGAVEYRIYRATSKDGTYVRLNTTTKTSYVNGTVEPGKTYYYKVVAVAENTTANSAYSSMKYRTCDLPRPTASVSLNSNDKPVVTWEKITGASKYKVYIYNADGTLLKTASASGTKLTHNTAEAGTTYSYRVVAVHTKSAANSAKSVARTIECPAIVETDTSIGNSTEATVGQD